ncbi:hypothetical protein WA1_18750 [Scytonema hofmannii PCC 7110]|uniref:Uncharacterized protein n=1 Tax=Scytonema hofmannii PCC 7110 TaxID=128403 RepID=A0A139XBP8_9CYAN|nr:hypothetical protein [Scytonema hofmannii]KYC42042.1 hypothetical protein WA1_18750 [Scytonema hofmannii PCC 7110]
MDSQLGDKKHALTKCIQSLEGFALEVGFSEKEIFESFVEWLFEKDRERFDEVIKSLEAASEDTDTKSRQ